jgi:hypothetical protein
MPRSTHDAARQQQARSAGENSSTLLPTGWRHASLWHGRAATKQRYEAHNVIQPSVGHEHGRVTQGEACE